MLGCQEAGLMHSAKAQQDPVYADRILSHQLSFTTDIVREMQACPDNKHAQTGNANSLSVTM